MARGLQINRSVLAYQFAGEVCLFPQSSPPAGPETGRADGPSWAADANVPPPGEWRQGHEIREPTFGAYHMPEPNGTAKSSSQRTFAMAAPL